jgi:hypothetical protein
MAQSNNKKHDYNFIGGNYLRRIGASYYVCYLYGINIDPNETRWQQVKTKDARNKIIVNHANLCRPWLDEISQMEKVGTNTMGLTVSEVKKIRNILVAEATEYQFPIKELIKRRALARRFYRLYVLSIR